MIFSGTGKEKFFIDVLVHSFFSYVILLILFFVINNDLNDQELLDTLRQSFDSNIMDGFTTPTDNAQTYLDELDSIYRERDKIDTELNDEIVKATFMQLIIFLFCFILIMIIINKNYSYYKHFLLDKLITFTIFASVIYIINEYVKSKYATFFAEDAYDVMKQELKKLTRFALPFIVV